jgi:hypothetical protein
VVPTLPKAEPAGNTSDVPVDQQLLFQSAGGNSVPNVSLPDVPRSVVSLPVPRPDGAVGQKLFRARIAEKAMVIVFRLRSGTCLVHFPCSNVFIAGIDYYPRATSRGCWIAQGSFYL